MGILKRFTTIMSAKVSAFKAPKNEINEYIKELESDLNKVKSEIDSVIVNAQRLKRELDECEESINKYERYAERSTKASEARIYNTKKEELIPKYNSLQQSYQLAKENADKMLAMKDKLSNDIAILKEKLEDININKSTNVSQVQEKVESLKNTADALEELNSLSMNDDEFNKEFEALLNDDTK